MLIILIALIAFFVGWGLVYISNSTEPRGKRIYF